MIQVNFRDLAWEEGRTIADLITLIKKDQQFRLLSHGTYTVIVNQELIRPSDYATKKLQTGDDVRIYPVMAGG